MINVEKTVLVKAGINQAWDIVSDMGGVYKYHPLVKRSPVLSENAVGIGATRRCEFYDGSSVVEKVTELKEGKELKVALSNFSMPFISADAIMRLQKASDKSTFVTIQMSYKMKYGAFGSILGYFMIKPIMKMTFVKVLEGLNDHVTTGKLIGEKGALLQMA